MAATQTKNIITAIRQRLADFEAASVGGVPVDAPLYFADVASLAAKGAASSTSEFGEELG